MSNNFNLGGTSSTLNTTQLCMQSIIQQLERVAGEGFINHARPRVIGFWMPLNVMDTARTEKTDALFWLVSFTIFFFFKLFYIKSKKSMSALNMFGSLHHISVALFWLGFLGWFLEMQHTSDNGNVWMFQLSDKSKTVWTETCRVATKMDLYSLDSLWPEIHLMCSTADIQFYAVCQINMQVIFSWISGRLLFRKRI